MHNLGATPLGAGPSQKRSHPCKCLPARELPHTICGTADDLPSRIIKNGFHCQWSATDSLCVSRACMLRSQRRTCCLGRRPSTCEETSGEVRPATGSPIHVSDTHPNALNEGHPCTFQTHIQTRLMRPKTHTPKHLTHKTGSIAISKCLLYLPVHTSLNSTQTADIQACKSDDMGHPGLSAHRPKLASCSL